MSKIGPLDHIARPTLPWRTEPELTECGKRITELGDRVVTRAAIEKRIRDIGQQRAAFTTCMTCAETSNRWTRMNLRGTEAILAVVREGQAVEWASPPEPPGQLASRSAQRDQRTRELWDRRQQFAAELEAIAALVAAHREEFDDYLAGLEDTVSLAERRRTKQAMNR